MSNTIRRKPGRPRLQITPEQVAELRRAPERWTWEQTGKKLGISADTAEKLWRSYVDIKPIETHYAGHLFRSRLEARFAVFFDTLGVGWVYEPEGYVVGGKPYLPDFWLPREGLFFEVKGQFPTVAEKDLCGALTDESGHGVVLSVGLPCQYPSYIWHFNADGLPPCSRDCRDIFNAESGLVWGSVDGDITTEPVPYIATGRPLPLTNDDNSGTGSRLSMAILAAKKARFEHGEKGYQFRR